MGFQFFKERDYMLCVANAKRKIFLSWAPTKHRKCIEINIEKGQAKRYAFKMGISERPERSV